MANNPAKLSPEEERKLKNLEKEFSKKINQDVILVAYRDEK